MVNRKTKGVWAIVALTVLYLGSCQSNAVDANGDATQGDDTQQEDGGLDDSSGDSTSRADQDTGQTDLGPSPDDFEPDDLPTTYASRFVMSSIAKVPFVGQVNSLTISLSRFDVTPIDQNEFRLTQTICAIEQQSDNELVKIVFPDAFVESLAAAPRHLVFADRLSSREVTIRRQLELRGFVLDDPENDPLPTQADDPAVTDQDGDGLPGMTIRVQGLVNGELYIIQRTWDRGAGRVSTDPNNGRIRGLIEWDQEQRILGSDNDFLEADRPTWVDPVAENSWFMLVPIDPSIGCDDLLSNQETIFD